MTFTAAIRRIFRRGPASGAATGRRDCRTGGDRGGRLCSEQLESRALLAPVVAGPTTTAPDLVSASDSGPSATDNKTSVAAPIFFGVAKGAAVVNVTDGPTLLGQAQVAPGTGYWFFTSPRLADGPHLIAAQALGPTNVAGRQSKPLRVDIGTVAPAAPTITGLTAATDSGIKGDLRTNVIRPMLFGTAPSGATVSLTVDGVPVGKATVRAGGWAFTMPKLADGPRAIAARITDVFGNVSEQAVQTVTIDRTTPTAQMSYSYDDLAASITFSRPVTGLSLGAFRVSGRLASGLAFDQPISSPAVQRVLGNVTLTQQDATTYRLQIVTDQLPVGSYVLRLVAKNSRIVDTVAGNALTADAVVTASIQ
ncbi:MAG: hypothetical protein EBZ59_02570 [Planctomycetia bacterium]|nr:hypothetical protein [Planctomycetia bacterium]